jgi:hypothetical protein
VLRRAHAHPAGRRIAVADFKVDIAQRRIEGRRIGVAHALPSVLYGTALGTGTGTLPTVYWSPPVNTTILPRLLEARRIRAQHQHRPRRPTPYTRTAIGTSSCG